MTSCDVFKMIESIAAASGNAQQEMIGNCMDESELFVEVCKRALDPFITYGVKKVPVAKQKDSTLRPLTADTWVLLDKLASRELTGNAAQRAIEKEMEGLFPESAELLSRIIKKDLRARFSAKSLNRHRPGTVFIFDCMLSHKYEAKRIKAWPVAVEPKFDGVRCLVIVKDGKAKFYSRTGKEFLNYGHIGEQLTDFAKTVGLDCVPFLLDGEIMDGEFNNTVGTAHRKGEAATTANYHVFEAMTLDQFGGGNDNPFHRRRRGLELLTNMWPGYGQNVFKTECRMMNSEEEIMAWNAELQAKGGEGVIVKPLDGLYERKRSHAWMKIKGSIDHDLVVTGFFEGEGKFAGSLGGLIVDLDGVSVKVGSGLTDEDRASIWQSQDDYLGRLAAIKGHELTPDGSIRHPVFVRWRDDKPVEDGAGC